MPCRVRDGLERRPQLVLLNGVSLGERPIRTLGSIWSDFLVARKSKSQLNQAKRGARWSARSALALLVAGSFLCSYGIDLPSALASASPEKKNKQDASLKNLPITELSAEEAIQHALNRLAYGPRPGDVERVKQMGLAKWIDQQLNPNSIDDKALEARLDFYPTLRMSTTKLLAQYPQPKQAAKKEGLSKEEFKEQQMQQRRADMAAEKAAQQHADSAADGESMKDIPSPMKQESGNAATPGAGGNRLSVDPNVVPRAIADDSKRPQRVVEELAMAKVTRAIYSER